MKLGIIGSGMIVKDFLSFAHELSEIKLEAITARNIENLKELQSKYNIKEIYNDIDLCLQNKEIDTIYVAVPNHLHYTVAKKALEAGKNVICEKPFTLKYDEAVELFEIAEDKGLILIEAITNQYQKNYLDIKDNIDNIGEIRLVECNFSQLSSRYEAFKNGVIAPVFDKSKGGGVLGDLNIYNIHFVVGLFGKPNKVHYSPNIVNDVDTSGILLLEYDNFKVVCIAAKDTFNNSYVNIQGDQGIIKVIGPTNEVPNYSIQTKDNLINENKNSIDEQDWRYIFISYYKVMFNKMNRSQYRLKAPNWLGRPDEMLLIPNKNSRARNFDIHLLALKEKLKEFKIDSYYESEPGIGTLDRVLHVKNIYEVRFYKNCYYFKKYEDEKYSVLKEFPASYLKMAEYLSNKLQ